MKGEAMSAMSEGQQPESLLRKMLVVGAIAAAAFAAYYGSFPAPFLFDDHKTIENNPSIRHLDSVGVVLFPPEKVFSAGRPFLNLTFAVNYALGGISVTGYHIANLLIHILAGITLFGIVKATLSQPKLREKFNGEAPLLAMAIAIVWMLHPIQTESVTYISQRAESLMGLCYLLTLYFFIRTCGSRVPGLWASLSVSACALGMMTKEVMVTAPLAVLLYDRAFIAGSFREAWRQRRRVYLGLAATWLVLAVLMANSGLRHRGVGYAGDFTWWTYALTESKVVVEYLRLSLWPNPLVFDYGHELAITHATEAAPYLLILSLLISLALLGSKRCPSLGFLGVWFFLILAPTSSVVPIASQPMAENRTYLPLAAIVTLGVIGLYALAGRKGLLVTIPALAITLGVLTSRRNSDYRSEFVIWSDTVLKCPGNARAQDNLGGFLGNMPGRLPEAIVHYEAALKIDPEDAEAHNNLGTALETIPGRLPDAIAHYEAALLIRSDFVEAHYNLGSVLARVPGRLPDAIAHFEAALKINPGVAEAHLSLGNALLETGGHDREARDQFETALRLRPDWQPLVASLLAARH
jgi:protein O-mannosyl-transferase